MHPLDQVPVTWARLWEAQSVAPCSLSSLQLASTTFTNPGNTTALQPLLRDLDRIQFGTLVSNPASLRHIYSRVLRLRLRTCHIIRVHPSLAREMDLSLYLRPCRQILHERTLCHILPPFHSVLRFRWCSYYLTLVVTLLFCPGLSLNLYVMFILVLFCWIDDF